MKSLLVLIIAILISLPNYSFSQTQINAGDVSGTWTLTGSPYHINGEITIPNLQTLVIEPGVLVEFQGHYKLNVQGRLLAEGTENDSIILTINDTTGFSNPNIPAGGWSGIRFDNTSFTNDSSKISYCKLQYGKAIGSWPDQNGGAISVMYFDKLTISNCLITNNIAGGYDWPGGGGIAIYASSPKIIGNTISHNSAMVGGGMQLSESNSLIDDNVIAFNSADNGGGILCDGNSNIVIKNVLLSDNSADFGGGICFWDNANPTLSKTAFIRNKAGWGGGIHAYRCNLQIDSCGFSENEALNGNGGAINHSADTATVSGSAYQASITNSNFNNNYALQSGGAVRIRKENVDSSIINTVIYNCDFYNNYADRNGGLKILGNAANFCVSNCKFVRNETIRFGAGFGFSSNSNGHVYNCLFISNDAATQGGTWNSGGGYVWSGANVDFMNCAFANNSAAFGAGITIGGGGIVTTTNCIFWDNNSDQIALDISNNMGGTLTINYCDVQGGIDSVNVVDTLSICNWETGNINADPFFVNAGNDDYHLQDNSPCIGAGIDTIMIGGIWHYCPTCDCEGNTRPYPAGSMPDMGTFENPLGNPNNIKMLTDLFPKQFYLFQNYPNPFNPTTTIEFSLPKAEFVTLKIYNLLGQAVITLVSEQLSKGMHNYTWDASNYASGVYHYKIESRNFTKTRKLLLIK